MNSYFNQMQETGKQVFNQTQHFVESYPEKVITQIKEQQDLLSQTSEQLNKAFQNPMEWNKANEIWFNYFNKQSQHFTTQVEQIQQNQKELFSLLFPVK